MLAGIYMLGGTKKRLLSGHEELFEIIPRQFLHLWRASSSISVALADAKDDLKNGLGICHHIAAAESLSVQILYWKGSAPVEASRPTRAI